MQMNHFPEPLPWFHKPAVDSTRNLNHYPVGDDFEDRLVDTPIPMHDKEAMFEKPLTPSDVGKLNRLVIPKQHAERYFPLGAGDATGTLLGFEDESGKSWRFRYSYWNSSQSYVLTKGWSRYVKDKRLDAGDVVFFERHRADREKLFIGWRRRGTVPSTAVCYNAQGGYRLAPAGIPPNYQPDCPPRHPGGGPAEEEEKATPVPLASNNNNHHHPSTRLVRLFGVNFECQRDDSSPRTTSSEGSTSSSIQQQQQQQAYHNYCNYMGYPAAAPSYHQHQHQMDMEYEHGVKQMGNRLS